MHLVPESLIPYLVITLNCFVFWTLRRILNPVLPRKIRLFVWEVIATVELCSGCAELGVVWAKHGNIGLALALFSACVWWSFHFDDAEACPCGPIEDVILFKEPITRPNISFRFIGQILGGYLTAKYTDSIWAFHLTEEHQHFHGSKCEAALQSTVVNAFFVELTITFISRIVALKTERMSNQNLVIVINSLTTVLLSLSAQDSSGGFFNPVLASALTLNCEGNDLFEHFIVYWVGSLIGGLMARYIHTYSLMRTDQKSRKKVD